MLKRAFDIMCSFTGLIVLSPLFAVAAISIKIDSKGPVFFLQERMGRNFRPFRIIKFRTMAAGAERAGSLITVSGDSRITRLGHILRKYKIDELPQLINVLKGDMSLVGPRPEVKKYVELFRTDYGRLLTVRPGITDPASLRYSDEEGILLLSANWEEDYVKRILPAKIRLSSAYVDNHGVVTDIKLILKTILRAAGADPAQGLRAES
jgi:lipopolysaccharide/colanic/teichoic acid biosynthesis glycosyltransferase